MNIQDVDVQGFEQDSEGIHKPGLGYYILMLFFSRVLLSYPVRAVNGQPPVHPCSTLCSKRKQKQRRRILSADKATSTGHSVA